jgi:hypothetical protein
MIAALKGICRTADVMKMWVPTGRSNVGPRDCMRVPAVFRCPPTTKSPTRTLKIRGQARSSGDARGNRLLERSSGALALDLPTPRRQPRANVQLVAVRIDNRHAAQARKVFVRGFLNRHTLPPKFAEPGVDVSDVQVDQPADWAVAGVFGQKKGEPFPGDLHENRKTRLEPMFPNRPEIRGPRRRIPCFWRSQ